MHVIQISLDTIFQAVADRTRLRIMRLLAQNNEEMCPCEITDSLLEPEYKISRHLKTLRTAGLITSSRDGKWIYHGLTQDEKYLKLLKEVILNFPDTDQSFKADLTRFKRRLRLRKKGRCTTGAQFNSNNKIQASSL